MGFRCASTAEAWGLYQAVMFARDNGFSKVQFESDNEKLIRMVQHRVEVEKSYMVSIVLSILSILPFFSQWSFTHVKRSGNSVAHSLAQIATTEPNRIWLENVPAQALSLYFADLFS
jgi:ribonuclease HI